MRKEADARRKSLDFSNPEPNIFKRLANRGNAEEFIIIKKLYRLSYDKSIFFQSRIVKGNNSLKNHVLLVK